MTGKCPACGAMQGDVVHHWCGCHHPNGGVATLWHDSFVRLSMRRFDFEDFDQWFLAWRLGTVTVHDC